MPEPEGTGTVVSWPPVVGSARGRKPMSTRRPRGSLFLYAGAPPAKISIAGHLARVGMPRAPAQESE